MSFVLVVTAATAVVGVFSAIQQGKQAQRAADADAAAMDYNAAADRAKATHANKMAGIQEDSQRKRARQVIGSQLASSAGAGAGLNQDLLRESIFNMESDTEDIRYDGKMKAAGYRDQATLTSANAGTRRQQGKEAVNASYLNAAGSLLNAGTSYYKGTR